MVVEIGRPIVTCVEFDAQVRSTGISVWLVISDRDAQFRTQLC
jgi:hypothetical protein